jgi:hypothetical protein
MKQLPHYNKIINVLRSIHKEHPKYTMGKHISTALDGYDIWNISDKEMLFAFEKYAAELQFDIPHEDRDINDIIYQGMHLNSLRESILYEDGEDD